MGTQINVIQNDNEVSVNNVYQQIRVIDNNREGNIVNVIQPISNVITVKTGPAGAMGPPGSGSLVSSSYSHTSSYSITSSHALNAPVVGSQEFAFGNSGSGAITSSAKVVFDSPTSAFIKYTHDNYAKLTMQGWAGLSDSYPALYFLPTATTPSISNYTLTSDLINTYLNAPTGSIRFLASNSLRMSINSASTLIYSGLVATDYGVRLDAVGFRIGQYGSLGVANNYPFEVSGFMRVNQPAGGYGVTLENPAYGHSLSINFNAFDSIYQQSYGNTIFRSDSYNGSLGQIILNQNGKIQLIGPQIDITGSFQISGSSSITGSLTVHDGINLKASFTSYPILYNNYNSPLYWYADGGIQYLVFAGPGNPTVAQGLLYNGTYTGIISPNVVYTFIGGSIKMTVTDTYAFINNPTIITGSVNITGSIIAASTNTATDYGYRLDSVGFRIGQKSTLNTTNTYVFQAGGLTYKNTGGDYYFDLDTFAQLGFQAAVGKFLLNVAGGNTFLLSQALGYNQIEMINNAGTVFTTTGYHRFNTLQGTGSRMVETDPSGSISADVEILDQYIVDTTIINYLLTGSNWSTGSYDAYLRKYKEGIVPSSSFGGSPWTASVTFSVPFTSNNYSVVVTGEDARMWSIQSKLSGSFVINSNSTSSITGSTFYQAVFITTASLEVIGDEYIGPPFTGSYQGQRYFDDNYIFECVSDNNWIRSARA